MNRHFNYELDERYIRITLLDSEVDINEADWQRFDASRVKNKCSSVSFSGLFSQVDLSVSRSVLVPAVFVIGIVLFSMLLFSFVDFKGKNAKSIDANSTTTINPEEKTSEPTLTNNAVVTAKKDTIIKKDILTTSQLVDSIKVKLPEQQAILKPEVKPTQNVKKITPPTITPEVVLPPIADTKPSKAKRKKKKETHVELQSINTTKNILESEPEAELQLH